MEADKKTDNEQSGAADSLANALGINLVWRDNLPEELGEKQRELFFFTAQEAIINAVKHAGAKNMEISFEKAESVTCFFKNDGTLPEGEVNFEGGLLNLSLLAEKQGAEVYTKLGEEFTLCLKYPPIG